MLSTLSRRLQPRYVWIPLIYASLSFAYIVISGLWFGNLLEYSAQIMRVEIGKGLVFVAVTTAILWFALVREHRAGQIGETTFRGLVEHLPDAVFLVRLPERSIYYANPAAVRIFGYPAEKLISSNTELLHVSPEHYEKFYTLSKNVSPDQPYVGDFEMRRSNGEVFPTSHLVEIFTDEHGNQFVVSVVRDESERRRMESQLREVQKMDAIGQLTGGIAHDFNNLLTVILGRAEMLGSAIGEDSPLHGELDAIVKASERAALLTQRLLAFSRRQSLRSERIDLNALIRDTVGLVSRTLGTHIMIRTTLADEVWPVELDREQLETGLLNLAINARDAMPDGGELRFATVNVSSDESAAMQAADLEPGEYVRLTVEDTGTGMSGEVAARAYDPFFTTKPEGKGTGLGLSMVYGFVKQSGGAIHLDTAPGKGTRFSIYLPSSRG